MPDIEVRRVHELGLAEARAAADRMMETLASRFGLRAAWEGNVLRFERPGVSGYLAIEERSLHLAVTLGFLLRAMRGTIQSEVLRELDTLFSTPAGPASAAKKSH